MKLTPEQIRAKQVANVIRKLNAGKTLTAREERMLAEERGGDGVRTSGPTVGNFAKTWADLATAVGMDRRTLTNVRKQFGKKCPPDRPDGRKEVAAWIRFLADAGVVARGENNPAVDFTDERALRLQERKLRVRREEFELDKAMENMLPVAEFEAALGMTLGEFRAAMNAMPGRATAKLIERVRGAVIRSLRAYLPKKQWELISGHMGKMQIEYGEIEDVLIKEKDAVLMTLTECNYLRTEERELQEETLEPTAEPEA